MNVAILLAVFTATVSVGTGLAHLAVSQAPGWRASRTFALIAFSAGLYSIGNVTFCSSGLPPAAYLVVLRTNYLAAHLHALGWIPMAYGGPDASWAGVPRPLRVGMLASVAIALVFALTGIHLVPIFDDLHIAWANVTYHYVRTTPIGDAYGTLIVFTLLVPFGGYVARMVRGERDARGIVVGFTIFFAAAVVELLVANRVIVWLSPADLGFLAVVAPTSATMLRRFVAEARRFSELNDVLAGQVLERTAERDDARTALAESERLAALGRLAAGVGHEINNPLTYVQLSLTTLQERLDGRVAEAEGRTALAHAREGVERIRKVVEGLRTYSRPTREPVPVAPADVVSAALRVAGPQLRHSVEVSTAIAAVPHLLGDEGRLVQALVNLLVNAAQAVGDADRRGRIVVRVAPLGDRVAIEVEDDGPGIPAELRARVAEPYFTTRAQHGGLGLGLFVTRGIVAAHGGTLELLPAPARGTLARMSFPAAPDHATVSAPAAAPAAPLPASAERRGRLLVVDDEPIVLELLADLLQREWDVTSVGTGAEALEQLARGSYAAILCDLMMPGLSGMDVAARVEREHPGLHNRMVFLTGGAVTSEAEDFLARPGVRYVMKPVDVPELFAALRAVTRDADAAVSAPAADPAPPRGPSSPH